jgi:hypothetical protein
MKEETVPKTNGCDTDRATRRRSGGTAMRNSERLQILNCRGAAGWLALLPLCAQCLMSSSIMPLSRFSASTTTFLGGSARAHAFSHHRNFASGIALSAVAPKGDANKNKPSKRHQSALTRALPATETACADSSTSTTAEEVLVGRWVVAGTAKPRRKDAEKDQWLEWLTDGFPHMLTTISALTDHRASARKAAVGEILKCAQDHPAGPQAPWAVAALAGRLEDDSGKYGKPVRALFVCIAKMPRMRNWQHTLSSSQVLVVYHLRKMMHQFSHRSCNVLNL